jgi:ATP-dependent Clp protease ATP-binding subunit ClpB
MSNHNTIKILNNLENNLKKKIIGQADALSEIIHTFNHGELLLTRDDRPKGVLLFLGPTGTGKTETALTLAESIYQNKNKLERFDMSEYMDESSISTQFLTNLKVALERHGEKGAILLLDEIEKANRKICNLFLQAFDAARITIEGKVYNLSNYYCIVTTNVGSQKIAYGKFENKQELQESIEAELRNEKFTPEFIGRFDQKLCFNFLNYEAQKSIAFLNTKSEVKRLSQVTGIELTYDKQFINHCCRYGVNRDLGARPLRNFIEKAIQAAITKVILSGEKMTEGHITVNKATREITLESVTEKKDDALCNL